MRRSAMKASVAGLALTVAFVTGWEGVRLVAYLDIGRKPTICAGETKGVSLGDRSTREECDEMLVNRLAQFEREIAACIEPWDSLPQKTQIALVSWAYNVGSGGACRSTAVRRINAGDYRGGCDAVTWWNKVGGKRIRGLVNRRTAEHKLCVADL